MSKQRSDHAVIADAAKFNATKRALERFLRRQGIRNPHTSKKGREAIARAATMRFGSGDADLARQAQIAQMGRQ